MVRPAASLQLAFLATFSVALARPQWHHGGGNHPAPSVQAPVVATTTAETTEPTTTASSSSGGGGTTPVTNSTSSGGGKGVVYNPGDAQRAVSLAPDWACDWDSTSGLSDPPFTFVPQLWGPTHTISASDVADAVLYYNEPEICATGAGGSCVPTPQVISDFSGFQTQMAGKQISTPCTSNGPAGVAMMTAFLAAYPTGVDILCFHWYGTDLAGLQSTVNQFKGLLPSGTSISQVWISEMGDNNIPTDISQYTDYLDGAVDKYAYNLYNLGAGGII